MSLNIVAAVLFLSSFMEAREIIGIMSDGDFVLGGLFPVHDKGTDTLCGAVNWDRGIQRLEAMRFAVNEINNSPSLLRGVTIGMRILDSCSDPTYALDQSLDFVMSTFDSRSSYCSGAIYGTNKSDISENKKRDSIVAVVGASYSSVSTQVANLLRLFKIPQVSYASTSAELSAKDRFGYFMRTVPPDNLQAKAMVDIIEHFNWTFVSSVASEGEYGESGIVSLKRVIEAKSLKVCFAVSARLPRNARKSDYDKLIEKLYLNKRAKVVVLFVTQDDAFGVLRAAMDQNLYDDFIWLASDGWGNGVKPVTGNEKAAKGALTVTLQNTHISQFDDYFLSLLPENNKENVWFTEYWESVHNCKYDQKVNLETEVFLAERSTNQTLLHANVTQVLNSTAISERMKCTGKEKLPKYKQEGKIQFVYDAVYAIALSLDRIYQELCGQNASALCAEMRDADAEEIRTRLLQYMKEGQYQDPYGNPIRFDKNGDSPGFYNIMNYGINPDTDRHEYMSVGSWNDSVLELQDNKIQWPGEPMPHSPMSICSLPCETGYRKEMKDEKCCWVCIPCGDDEYLSTEYTCTPCAEGFWPTNDKANCSVLSLHHMTWDSPFTIAPAVMSLLGILMTIFTVTVFLKHRDTPVVRAAGRELSFMLLVGCAVCYCSAISLLIKPSTAACVVQRLSVGGGFAIIYSALLTKTNRIYRIFAAARRTTKRPIFVSPKSQVVIASLLALVQVLVFAVWMLLEPPGTRTDIPDSKNKSFVVLKCKAQDLSTLLALSYNMLLIVVCTIYAIMTRKIPSNFNESKFIGLTMYTTCIVWLSFVPIFFGLKSSFQIQSTTLCIAVTLSATVALLCLFGPKLYIILFHPEKNSRKNNSDRGKFSNTHKKTETDFVPDSPRSRASSIVIGSPLHNGMRKVKDLNELQKIPEEARMSMHIKESCDTSISGRELNDLYNELPTLEPLLRHEDDVIEAASPGGYSQQDDTAALGSHSSFASSASRDSAITLNKCCADPLALDSLKAVDSQGTSVRTPTSIEPSSHWDYMEKLYCLGHMILVTDEGDPSADTELPPSFPHPSDELTTKKDQRLCDNDSSVMAERLI